MISRKLLPLAVAAGLLLLTAALFQGLQLLYMACCRCFLDAYVAIQTW